MPKNRQLVTVALLLIFLAKLSSAADPRTFVVGLWPNRLGLFDEATESYVGEIHLRYGAVTGYGTAVHSPDFSKLYYITDRMEAVEIVDPRKREVVDEIRLSTPGRQVRIFSLSPDPRGKLLYLRVSAVDLGIDRFEGEDVEYVVFDLDAHEVKETFRLPPSVDKYLGFFDVLLVSQDGSSLFTVGKDIHELRSSDRTVLDTIVLSRPLDPGYGALRMRGFVEATPGVYRGLYRTKDPVMGKDMTGVYRVDLQSKRLERFDLGPAIDADVLTLSNDGRYGWAGLKDLARIDMETEKIVAIRKGFEQGRTNNTIILSADEKKLYVTGVGNNLVMVDSATLETLGTIPLGADIMSPALPIPRIPGESKASPP